MTGLGGAEAAVFLDEPQYDNVPATKTMAKMIKGFLTMVNFALT